MEVLPSGTYTLSCGLAQQQSFPCHDNMVPPHHKQIMSAVPRNQSWCQVSPLSTTSSQYSLVQVVQRFEPSVLSFQRFIYIGKTVPRHSMPPLLTDKRLIHPFEGFLVFCHWNAINTCRVSQHSVDERDDCFELQNDVITDSKKDGIENGLIDSCEYVYDRCELDYLPHNTNTEEDSDQDTDDNDSIVQFESSCTIVKCPAPDPLSLCHTFSFSSEESGFCEQSHIEWSDDDSDCDDVTESCNFDEGLWHDFEVQACFTGIPLRNGRNKKTCSKRTLSEQVQTSRSIKLCQLNEQEVTHNTSTTITLHTTETSSIGSQHMLSTSDYNYNDIHDRLTNTSGKRVTFKPDSELVVVHHLITWKYAYRACRKGPWEQYAADRERFHKRIQTVNAVLAPCLLNKLCTSQITEMYD